MIKYHFGERAEPARFFIKDKKSRGSIPVEHPQIYFLFGGNDE